MPKYVKLLYTKLRIGFYRSSIYPPHKKRLRNVEGAENNIENEPYFSTENVIFIEEFRSRFDACAKNGGYKKYFGKWIWVNHTIKYFPQKQRNIVNWGGVANFITKANLVYLENSIIYPNKFPGNFKQKYTFYIKQKTQKEYDLNKAISFNVGGAESFQHFMQDCLPIIAKSQAFLAKNPDICILLPKASKNFKNREYILNKFGVTNRIIETDQITSLNIRFLYFWNFTPYNSKYNLPPIFYKELRKALTLNIESAKNRAIVLFIRRENMRKFKNEFEITKCLKLISDLHQLDLIVIDTSIENIDSISKKTKQAIVIIGIHGGNTYNAIFCPSDCAIIEIVPIRNTNKNINYLSYSGIKYIPFPLNFNLLDEEVEVPVDELNMMVMNFLQSNK